MTKNIYLPIEIKPREFVSKVVLAKELATAGFHVYLGSKDIIYKLMKNGIIKGGIFFYKGGGLRYREDLVTKSVDHFVVLDEEMGLAVEDIDYALDKRIGNEDVIKKYFVLNEDYKKTVERIRPKMVGKITISGWPRIQIWNKSYHQIYSNEIEKIIDENGDYILFSSDFGFNDEGRIEEEAELIKKRFGEKAVNDEIVEKWNRSYKHYKKFIEDIKILDRQINTKVIIRPHPAENHNIWLNDCKGLKNFKVIYTGEITPWLLASKLLMHRGCTTSIQAFASDKTSIFLGEYAEKSSKPLLTRTLSSIEISDREGMRKIINGEVRIENIKAEKQKEAFNIKSIEIITKELSALDVSDSERVRLSNTEKLYYHSLAFLNKMRFKFIKSKRNERYVRKLQGGIHKEEVDSIFNSLNYNNLSVKMVAPNLVEIKHE